MRRRAWSVPIVLATAAVGAVGCTPGGDAVEATAPGTELTTGEVGTFPLPEAGEGMMFDVAVTAIEEGSVDDLAADVDDERLKDLKNRTIWYVHVDMSAQGASLGSAEGVDAADSLQAYSGEDELLAKARFGADVEECATAAFSGDESDGDVVETCFIVSTGEEQELGYAAWVPAHSPYDRLNGEPVTWRS